MHKEFKVYLLNGEGVYHAQRIAIEFDNFLTRLLELIPDGRELSIVRTKLEEACFFAKKGMAANPLLNLEVDNE